MGAMGAGLLTGGVPLAPVMAFRVASPPIDPETFALTASMLGWPLAVIHPGATLALSLDASYLTLAVTRSILVGTVSGILERPTPALVATPQTSITHKNTGSGAI